MNMELKPNVILLTIDSLRADHLGCYGYARNCSPNIDALASKGILFSQAITCGGQTPDAFPSMLASLPPSYRAIKEKPIDAQHPSMAQVLKDAGYQTAAFHSNPHISRYYGYGQGFDLFVDNIGSQRLWQSRVWARSKLGAVGGIPGKFLRTGVKVLKPVVSALAKRGPRTEAENLVTQALSWLERCRPPYFLWLHFMDVHHPYAPPGRFLKRLRRQAVSRQAMSRLFKRVNWPGPKHGELTDEELSLLTDLYDGAIMYVDENIRLLLDSAHCRRDNTIVIITADHGEEFGEHGDFSHHALYDEALRVPLIMAGPGMPQGKGVGEQVSLIDLAPTITSHLKMPPPPSFRGQSLLPIIAGERAADEGIISIHSRPDWNRLLISYRTPGWKYIRAEDTDGTGTVSSEEVYHLTIDPREKDNLHGRDMPEVRAFASRARERIAQHRRQEKAMKTSAEKERIRAKLGKLSGL